MNPRDYFPLGKALGEAFCNRSIEKKTLAENIKAGKHSLLSAPRRFGKSSLVDNVVAESKLPTVTINFNTCSDEQGVVTLVCRGVSQLIGNAFGSVEKITQSIKNYIKHLTPKISIGPDYARLELTADSKNSPAINIEETLYLLENLLKEKKLKAVIVFDEFQTVGIIARGAGIEAAIRNIAQDLKQLTIVFSGSNRSLLNTMFEDENRPLYKLCRKIKLNRIDKEHYVKHFNKAAKLAWKANLTEDVIDLILSKSESHPYYVNYLCDVLWTESKKLPKITDVIQAWALVLEEEQSDANAELASLSLGQKKILVYIANYSNENLLSADTVKEIGMALSSISGALTSLMEKDVIEKTATGGYQIINPALTAILRE